MKTTSGGARGTGRPLSVAGTHSKVFASHASLPARRIVNSEEFVRTMRALGERHDMAHIPGVTDKRAEHHHHAGVLWKNSHQTFLGAALHEAVTRFRTHRAGRETTQHRMGDLGSLLEGLVECVTRDILTAQGSRTCPGPVLTPAIQKRVPIARELLRSLSVPLLAHPILFGGDFQRFLMVMNHTHSPAGWTEIKYLTTANNPARAVQRMSELAPVEGSAMEDLKRRFSRIRSRAGQIVLNEPAQIGNVESRCLRGFSGEGTMATVSITSNDGALESASAVLEVSATNPEYNQPALRIKQAGKRGGAASIRIDDPNPDIEFVETGLIRC